MVLPGRDMSWKSFLHALWREWDQDRGSDIAGAVTFFGVLAIFPFLLFLVGLAGIIIDDELARELIAQLQEVAPSQVTEILQQQLEWLSHQDSSSILTIGGATALWASSGGMVSLMNALNTAYGVNESRPFWKVRGVAILMTLIAAAIGVVAALLIIAIPALAAAVGGVFGTGIGWMRIPIAGAMMMFLWALLYYVLPDVEQRFRFITPGSVFGVVVWVIASWGFSVYVKNFGNYERMYGTLGGVIVLLFWMWISAQVLLLGAEINSVLEHKSVDGKKPGTRRMAEAGPSGTKTEETKEQAAAVPPTDDTGSESVVTNPQESKTGSVS